MTAGLLTHLTDDEVAAAVARLVQSERATTTELVAHLAEFDARRLHLAAGYSSLFSYCCEVLHLSEHETYNRIEAARASRRFPIVLEELANRRVNLTTVRLLGPHLTLGNHRELLAAAAHLRKREVEELIARRFPRPDIATSIRKLPTPGASPSRAVDAPDKGPLRGPGSTHVKLAPAFSGDNGPRSSHRSSQVIPLAPERYEIRFTASVGTRDKLRQAQDLLRHAIPTGDPAAIFDRALSLLLDDLVRRKAAEVCVPAGHPRPLAPGSRHIPADVRRAVWRRDCGRCGFVGTTGRRCTATSRLEFHHVKPYAAGGLPTPDNIELRCRGHNAYEAALFYGPLREPTPRRVSSAARPASEPGTPRISPRLPPPPT